MKKFIIVAGWFFLATQYVSNGTPTFTALAPTQVGPFKSEKACGAVAATYQSGQISLYNPSILWQLTTCYSSNGDVTGIIHDSQS